MGNLNITNHWRIIAYANACQPMLSVSVALLTYEGLMKVQRSCYLCRTYAQRAWSEHEVHRFHGFKYIWLFQMRFIKQAFREFEIVHIKHDHECKILIIIKPQKGLSSPLKWILVQLFFFCHGRRHGVTSSLHYLFNFNFTESLLNL